MNRGQDVPFHIVFSTNAPHHLMYLAVAVRSVVQYCSEPDDVSIHILWSGLEPHDLARLERSWADLDFSCEFHNVDSLIEPISSHPSHGFWNFFWFDRFLPEDARRALYLDCDMVCSRDVCELRDLELGECVMGAVLDPLSLLEPLSKSLSRQAQRLGLDYDQDDLYFNSGMLLIDVPKWRAEDLATVVSENFFGGFGELSLHDQDSLNLLLRGRILSLSPCWNLIEYARLFSQWPYEIYPGDPKDYFANKIRHFSGERKPDCPWVRRSDKREFYRWLDKTDWSGWRSNWDRGLMALVFSRLLEAHYLVYRGFRQKAIDRPGRRFAELVLESPYVVPIYLLLPFYRLCRQALDSSGFFKWLGERRRR